MGEQCMMADSASFISPDSSMQEHGINEYIGLPPSSLDLWKSLPTPRRYALTVLRTGGHDFLIG